MVYAEVNTYIIMQILYPENSGKYPARRYFHHRLLAVRETQLPMAVYQ